MLLVVKTLNCNTFCLPGTQYTCYFTLYQNSKASKLLFYYFLPIRLSLILEFSFQKEKNLYLRTLIQGPMKMPFFLKHVLRYIFAWLTRNSNATDCKLTVVTQLLYLNIFWRLIFVSAC